MTCARVLEAALNQHSPPPRSGGSYSSLGSRRGRGGTPSSSSRNSRLPPQLIPGSFTPQQYYAPQHQYPQPHYIPQPRYVPQPRYHPRPRGHHICVVCEIKDISICLILNYNPRFARLPLAMANASHVGQSVQKNCLPMAHRTRICVM